MTDKARSTATKVVHREAPQRSMTSQLEDGILNEDTSRHSDSLLAPQLMPHYLGKTPRIVKSRTNGGPQGPAAVPAFRVPSFDSSKFKIPAMPTPPSETRSQSDAQITLRRSPPRAKGLKNLEISKNTQLRYDEEILAWLGSQNIQPRDLTLREKVKDMQVEDPEKLQLIMSDTGFFRRQGLQAPSEPVIRERITESRKQKHRDVSRSSVMSMDSERSSHTLTGAKLSSKNWQTHSSSGILSAWREICEQQDNASRSNTLRLKSETRSRRGSTMSYQHEPALWAENVSFSGESNRHIPNGTFEDKSADQTSERYWGPVRSFPVPEDRPVTSDSHKPPVRNRVISQGKHRRQLSTTRRTRRPSVSIVKTPRESRQHTPASATSSRRSTAAKVKDKSDQTKQTEPKEDEFKVEDQAQTNEIKDNDKVETVELRQPSPTIVTKERRKRAGCFSALDEDMEDIFGPYSDLPAKKPKLDDSADLLIRPRAPILREDEAIKRIRAEQAAKAAAQAAKELEEQEKAKNAPKLAAEDNTLTSFANLQSELKEDTKVLQPTVSFISTKPEQSKSTLNSQDQPKFSFGSSNITAEAARSHTETIKPSFSFTPTANPMTALNAKPVDAAPPVFAFGQPTKQKAEEPAAVAFKEQPDDTKTPVFSFGQTSSKESDAAVKPLAQDTPVNFSFQTAATVPPAQPNASPEKPALKNDFFASFKPPAAISQPAKEATAPNFTFGATNTNSDAPAKVESTNPQPSSQFSFATSKADAEKSGPAQQPVFSFGATQPTPVMTEPKSATEAVKAPSFGFSKPAGTPSSLIGEPLATSSPFGAQSGPATITGSSKPTFSFGESSKTTSSFGQSGQTQAPSTTSTEPTSFAPPSTNAFGSSTTTNMTNLNNSNPVFGGASGFASATAPSTSTSRTPAFTFGATVPAINNNSAAAPAFSFGATTTNNTTNTETRPNTATSSGFTAPTASFQFGAAAPASTNNAAPAFSFGASQPGANANSGFTFGAPANNTPAFGASSNAPQSNPFGFQQNQPVASAQPAFAFGQGQSQTAPNSGFASPAVQSPSIQSATAPGSPNIFNFNVGAPSQAGANGRKIAQPKSRRNRQGR